MSLSGVIPYHHWRGSFFDASQFSINISVELNSCQYMVQQRCCFRACHLCTFIVTAIFSGSSLHMTYYHMVGWERYVRDQLNIDFKQMSLSYLWPRVQYAKRGQHTCISGSLRYYWYTCTCKWNWLKVVHVCVAPHQWYTVSWRWLWWDFIFFSNAMQIQMHTGRKNKPLYVCNPRLQLFIHVYCFQAVRQNRRI